MYTSVRWINDYLDPPATADEQADLLTRAGFPLEGSEPVEGLDDVRQDFEMTSNRGDCVCHLGLAREIAAIGGRDLKVPSAAPAAGGPDVAGLLAVVNDEPERCPLYTARMIRGVTIGPSPAWLQERLRARGDIPRNNVVDATNFVLFEWGQPTHVFDLAKLAGPRIHVRMARPGESFRPIGEDAHPVKLTADDLVIADAERAVAIAGVKGGADSAVTAATTDIVLEAATFDPVAVRTASRRHNIASDSSYRFERGVHPAQVEPAAQRLAALILELAGGELCTGVLGAGAPLPAPRTASMRPERARTLLGLPIDDATMMDDLRRLGFEPRREGDRIHCTVPFHRLDIEREIDLIEEVGRMHGHDRIPIEETIRLRVAPPQPAQLARRAVHDALVGMGYVETVTHSLVSEDAAAPFVPAGAGVLRVDDERAGEPILRPSLVPSLLRVRAHNARNGVGDLHLFESGATWWALDDGHEERPRLTMLADLGDAGLRELRGTVERLARLLHGPDVDVEVAPDDTVAWLDPGALVRFDGSPVGHLGVVADAAAAPYDLPGPVGAAELDLPARYGAFPPDTEARPLPAHPAIARDVSIIVDEAVTWARIEAVVEKTAMEHLEATEFVTVFRGKGVGAGRKSVTLRCRFRAAGRTLTHDEVDPSMERLMHGLEHDLGAEIRR